MIRRLLIWLDLLKPTMDDVVDRFVRNRSTTPRKGNDAKGLDQTTTSF